MRLVKETNRFSKDFKRAIKRGKNPDKLLLIVQWLANDVELPTSHCLHKLSGKWHNNWECHIEPDWLLIFSYEEDGTIIRLQRTGSHTDLFE